MSAQRAYEISAEQLKAIRGIRSMSVDLDTRAGMTGVTCIPKSALYEPHYRLPARFHETALGFVSLDGAVDGAATSIEAGCAINYPASSRSSVSSTRTPAKLQRRRPQSQRSVPPGLSKKTGFWVGYRYDRGKESERKQPEAVGDTRHEKDDGAPKTASSSTSFTAEPFPPFEPVPQHATVVKSEPEHGKSTQLQPAISRSERASTNVDVRSCLLQPVIEEPVGYQSDTAALQPSLAIHAGDHVGYDSDSAVRRDSVPACPINNSPDRDSDATIRQTKTHRQHAAQMSQFNVENGTTQGKHIEFSKNLPRAKHVCQSSGHHANQGHRCLYQRPLQTCDGPKPNGSAFTTPSSSSLHTAPLPHPDYMCKDIEGDIHRHDRATDVHKEIYDYFHRNARAQESQHVAATGKGPASPDAVAMAVPCAEYVTFSNTPSSIDRPRQESTLTELSSSAPRNASVESGRPTYWSESQVFATPSVVEDASNRLPTTGHPGTNGGDARGELLVPTSEPDDEQSVPKQFPPSVQSRIRKDHPVELIFPSSNKPSQPPSIAPFTPLIPEFPLGNIASRDRSKSQPQPATPSKKSSQDPRLEDPKDGLDLRPAPLRISPRHSGATTRNEACTREVGTQTSRPSLKMSDSFVRQELNAELGASPVATYPWLSLSLVRQVRQTFRIEFATFQKQVDERLAALEDTVRSQSEWLEGMAAENGMAKSGHEVIEVEIPGQWEDGERTKNMFMDMVTQTEHL